MKSKLFIISAIAVFTTSALAQAQPIPSVSIDTPPSFLKGIFAAQDAPFYFNVRTAPKKSYCCEAISMDVKPQMTEMVANSGPSTTIHHRGDYEPILMEESEANTKGRICFTSEDATTYTGTVETACGCDYFDSLQITCTETTLYGGFNTIAGEINFLEITNRSNKAVTLHIRGYSSTDNSEKVNLKITLPENNTAPVSRADIDIHTHVGPASFGSLHITHDAPKGTISATLATYKINKDREDDYTPVARSTFETKTAM